jgi:hypothetical protein
VQSQKIAFLNQLNFETYTACNPDLSVAVELKQLNVTLKDFPQYLPITKIALTFFSTGDKLENLLGHFVDSYNNTLTHLYFILDEVVYSSTQALSFYLEIHAL